MRLVLLKLSLQTTLRKTIEMALTCMFVHVCVSVSARML